jgi:hypothetical protein
MKMIPIEEISGVGQPYPRHTSRAIPVEEPAADRTTGILIGLVYQPPLAFHSLPVLHYIFQTTRSRKQHRPLVFIHLIVT